MNNLLKRALITWTLFMPIAIVNGIVREFTYKHFVGDLAAHQISTVIGSIAFLVFAYLMLHRHVRNISTDKLLLVGLLWVAMTVIFEFGFGHYIDGASWEKLLDDYNILQGRIWGMFLLIVFFTPYIIKTYNEKRWKT